MSMRRSDTAKGSWRPFRHADHPRPVTRREFLAQGFITGAAMVVGPSARRCSAAGDRARAGGDRSAASAAPAASIPFLVFDLAGGASIAGSNVLVGGPGGQLDSALARGLHRRSGIPTGRMRRSMPRSGRHASSGSRSTPTARCCAASSCARRQTTRDRRERHDLLRALRQRHGQQPAQSDVRHQQGGRRGRAAHADRHAEPSDSGGNSAAPMSMIDPTVRPDQGGPPERRDAASSTPASSSRCSRTRQTPPR